MRYVPNNTTQRCFNSQTWVWWRHLLLTLGDQFMSLLADGSVPIRVFPNTLRCLWYWSCARATRVGTHFEWNVCCSYPRVLSWYTFLFKFALVLKWNDYEWNIILIKQLFYSMNITDIKFRFTCALLCFMIFFYNSFKII